MSTELFRLEPVTNDPVVPVVVLEIDERSHEYYVVSVTKGRGVSKYRYTKLTQALVEVGRRTREGIEYRPAKVDRKDDT